VTPALLELMGIRRRSAPAYPWWEVEDLGGWPPFTWKRPILGGTYDPDREEPWPTEWDRRPHP
jgi:hypothetical protein